MFRKKFTKWSNKVKKLARGLIVSCQAVQGEPLYGYNIMHLFAKAAVEGGAVGIRALASEISSIRSEVSVPVIGLTKTVYEDSAVYITPTLEDVREVLATGCEVIALDATSRPRHGGEKLRDLVAYIRGNSPETEIMADIATLDDVRYALELGFDYISTTLRGYTADTEKYSIPDFAFLRKVKSLLKGSGAAMIAEGGVTDCREMRKVRRIDPYAVVVGSAITRPKFITEMFAAALSEN